MVTSMWKMKNKSFLKDCDHDCSPCEEWEIIHFLKDCDYDWVYVKTEKQVIFLKNCDQSQSIWWMKKQFMFLKDCDHGRMINEKQLIFQMDYDRGLSPFEEWEVVHFLNGLWSWSLYMWRMRNNSFFKDCDHGCCLFAVRKSWKPPSLLNHLQIIEKINFARIF